MLFKHDIVSHQLVIVVYLSLYNVEKMPKNFRATMPPVLYPSRTLAQVAAVAAATDKNKSCGCCIRQKIHRKPLSDFRIYYPVVHKYWRHIGLRRQWAAALALAEEPGQAVAVAADPVAGLS